MDFECKFLFISKDRFLSCVISTELAPPKCTFTWLCRTNGLYVLIVPEGSAEICTHTYFRAVSVTFYHLQAQFTPDVNIRLGWSRLVGQDRLLFTHRHLKCVFCGHLWVLSSVRLLILWVLHNNSLFLHVEVHAKNRVSIYTALTLTPPNQRLVGLDNMTKDGLQ